MSDPIIFGQPQFDDDEVALVTATLRSRWIGQGPLVAEFERRLAETVWADHAIAVSSCTAAIELSLLACGIGPGDEVITTPLTFVATVSAIETLGAHAVLADIDPDTLLLTPEAAAAAITPRTKAVVPVSFAGRPLAIDGFLELAEANDLVIVEDAAHAIGGVADGLPIGATRHPRLLTCFSFYPNKNLASAEGGAITLADAERADALRSLRLHGLNADAWLRYRERSYHATLAGHLGRKANWTDLQAAVALPQLDKLDGFLATREHLAAAYDDQLGRIGDVRLIPRPCPGLRERHALHLYQVRVPATHRDPLVQRLREGGIGAAVHYPPIHRHPIYEHLAPSPLPVVEEVAAELVSLPLHPGMGPREVERVAHELQRWSDG